jgi:hypothetical protein
MADRQALLVGGPHHGEVSTDTGGALLRVEAHLYERATEPVDVDGELVTVYRHRSDCCNPTGGAVDGEGGD